MLAVTFLVQFSQVCVFVFVFACVFVFVIVIAGASVDSTCHELSEYVWSCGSVKHGKWIFGQYSLSDLTVPTRTTRRPRTTLPLLGRTTGVRQKMLLMRFGGKPVRWAGQSGHLFLWFWNNASVRKKALVAESKSGKALLSESSASVSLGGFLMGHDYEKLKLAEQTWLKDFQEVMRFTSRN